MSEFLLLLVIGASLGAVYSVAAAGLIVAYRTTGVFNFAHAQTAMFLAFIYWQLAYRWGLPAWLSAGVVLFVAAPLLGVVTQRLVVKSAGNRSAASLVIATLGLAVALQAISLEVWGTQARSLDPLFSRRPVTLWANGVVPLNQLLDLAVAALCMGLLAVFLHRTKTGLAMRCVVDNPNLAQMSGINAPRMSLFAWMISTAFAGIAGIFLAPIFFLDANGLILVVLISYSVALFGRLVNLPLAFFGGLGLGIGQTLLARYGPVQGWAVGLRPSLPFLALLVLLLIPRRRPLTAVVRGKFTGFSAGSSNEISFRAAAVLAAGAAVLVATVSDFSVFVISAGVAFGIMFLSFVPTTGLAGQIPLAQATFAGTAAFTLSHLQERGVPTFAALVVAALFSSFVAAVVALPAIRLHGIYLGLATLAVGLVADNLIFTSVPITGGVSGVQLSRPTGPVDFATDRAFLVLLLIVFTGMAVLVNAVRRGAAGRRLRALASSEPGLRALGANVTLYRVFVFWIGGLVVGIGGGMYGLLLEQVTNNSFSSLQSVTWFIFAFVGGLSSVLGALVGGLLFGSAPAYLSQFKALPNILAVLLGVAAIGTAGSGRDLIGSILGAFRGIKVRSRRPADSGPASVKLECLETGEAA